MKNELKDKGINIIISEVERLKDLNKKYYESEEPKETEELLKSISWTRTSINAKLDLLLDLDIINIDEWTITYRLISMTI